MNKEHYFEKAKYLWNEYVPKSGQADTVQGEHIRSIEKLRDEAQRNGNINWNSHHEKMANFIKETLISSLVFNEENLSEIESIIESFLDYKSPKTSDSPYDFITERIVDWYLVNQEPIPLKETDRINYTVDSEGVQGVIGDPQAQGNPLKLALNLSNEEMVIAALENGANIEQKTDDFDNTPLSTMATRGNIPMIQLLIKYGANINAVNSIGWSVLDMAKHKKEAKKYLKSVGAKSAQKGEI